MKQSRKASLIESGVNGIVGYAISVAACYFILPVFGFRATLSDSFAITLFFTALSAARVYVLRRLFEAMRA